MFPKAVGRHRLAAAMAVTLTTSLVGMGNAEDLPTLPYVTESACADLMSTLTSDSSTADTALNFVSNVCYTSRLMDFQARTEGENTQADNGATRSLPRASDPNVGEKSALDRQIEAATEQSEESWEDLAQGDPQAAYDLLRRLLGEEGNGS